VVGSQGGPADVKVFLKKWILHEFRKYESRTKHDSAEMVNRRFALS
jgi:hypothetical protein